MDSDLALNSISISKGGNKTMFFSKQEDTIVVNSKQIGSGNVKLPNNSILYATRVIIKENSLDFSNGNKESIAKVGYSKSRGKKSNIDDFSTLVDLSSFSIFDLNRQSNEDFFIYGDAVNNNTINHNNVFLSIALKNISSNSKILHINDTYVDIPTGNYTRSKISEKINQQLSDSIKFEYIDMGDNVRDNSGAYYIMSDNQINIHKETSSSVLLNKLGFDNDIINKYYESFPIPDFKNFNNQTLKFQFEGEDEVAINITPDVYSKEYLIMYINSVVGARKISDKRIYFEIDSNDLVHIKSYGEVFTLILVDDLRDKFGFDSESNEGLDSYQGTRTININTDTIDTGFGLPGDVYTRLPGDVYTRDSYISALRDKYTAYGIVIHGDDLLFISDKRYDSFPIPDFKNFNNQTLKFKFEGEDEVVINITPDVYSKEYLIMYINSVVGARKISDKRIYFEIDSNDLVHIKSYGEVFTLILVDDLRDKFGFGSESTEGKDSYKGTRTININTDTIDTILGLPGDVYTRDSYISALRDKYTAYGIVIHGDYLSFISDTEDYVGGGGGIVNKRIIVSDSIGLDRFSLDDPLSGYIKFDVVSFFMQIDEKPVSNFYPVLKISEFQLYPNNSKTDTSFTIERPNRVVVLGSGETTVTNFRVDNGIYYGCSIQVLETTNKSGKITNVQLYGGYMYNFDISLMVNEYKSSGNFNCINGLDELNNIIIKHSPNSEGTKVKITLYNSILDDNIEDTIQNTLPSKSCNKFIVSNSLSNGVVFESVNLYSIDGSIKSPYKRKTRLMGISFSSKNNSKVYAISINNVVVAKDIYSSSGIIAANIESNTSGVFVNSYFTMDTGGDPRDVSFVLYIQYCL